ncbi:MAG: acylneuraminate cytidylyltransferase family protein [Roseicyclus sp.]|nr:acylneuraminate cytidylyltransferase family protein [Roseicyclus sp.]
MPETDGHMAGQIVALLPVQAVNSRSSRSDLAMLAGKPLFVWVLETLLSLPVIDRVVINTDAELAIAQSGLRPGPRVMIRSRAPDLRGEVSINQIIADDLAAVPADTYLMTHPTNPLLRASTVAEALDRFTVRRAERAADSLFSVTRIQARLYDANGIPFNHDPGKLLRTSALAPYFEENGNFYIFDSASFAATGSRIGTSPEMFETPRMESYSATTRADWFLTESLARRIKAGEPMEALREDV